MTWSPAGLVLIAPMAPVGVFGTLDARPRGAVAPVCLAATAAMVFTAFSYAQRVQLVPGPGRCSPTRAWGSAGGRVSSPAERRGRTVGWAGLSVVAVTLGAWL